MLFAYVFNLSLDELIIRKTTIGSDILDDIREKIKNNIQKF